MKNDTSHNTLSERLQLFWLPQPSNKICEHFDHVNALRGIIISILTISIDSFFFYMRANGMSRNLSQWPILDAFVLGATIVVSLAFLMLSFSMHKEAHAVAMGTSVDHPASHQAFNACLYIFCLMSLAYGAYFTMIDGTPVVELFVVVAVYGLLLIKPMFALALIPAEVIVPIYLVSTGEMMPQWGLVMLYVYVVCLMGATSHYNDRVHIERTAQEREILLRTDMTTGLHSTYAFKMLTEELEGERVAILTTDVDDLKFYNEHVGRLEADRFLVTYADILAEHFGRQNCYSLGAGMFVAVLIDKEVENFDEVRVAFFKAVEDYRFSSQDFIPSLSGGYVIGTVEDKDTLNKIIELSDLELYVAKKGGKGRVIGCEYSSEAMTSQRELVRELHHSGFENFDIAKGLPNYLSFRREAPYYIHRLLHAGKIPTFLYFNFAGMKTYNSNYGYGDGDELLRETGRLLRETFTEGNVAYYSDDHFVAIVDGAHLQKRITDVTTQVSTEWSHGVARLKCGAAEFSEGLSQDGRDTVERAKMACDTIRENDARFFALYTDDMGAEERRRQYVRAKFEECLQNGCVFPYYQPIVDAQSGKVCSLEVLARWNDPMYGFISPGFFVPVLEKYHLAPKLDRHMLEIACNDLLREASGTFDNLSINVNLSRNNFGNEHLADDIAAIIDAYGLPKSRFHVEITESVAASVTGTVDAAETIKRQIARFHELGIEVEMDDFGCGYSSLGSLREFDFDTIKLDMTFLSSFGENESDRDMLSQLITMIESGGMRTLAEGVETDEQRRFLVDAGCDLLQGYYFSKPAPIGELQRKVSSGSLQVI